LSFFRRYFGSFFVNFFFFVRGGIPFSELFYIGPSDKFLKFFLHCFYYALLQVMFALSEIFLFLCLRGVVVVATFRRLIFFPVDHSGRVFFCYYVFCFGLNLSVFCFFTFVIFFLILMRIFFNFVLSCSVGWSFKFVFVNAVGRSVLMTFTASFVNIILYVSVFPEIFGIIPFVNVASG
jgi:hypothetical protein